MKSPSLSEIGLGASLLLAPGCASNKHLNPDFFGPRSQEAAQAEAEFISGQIAENCKDVFGYAYEGEVYTDAPIGVWYFEAPEADFRDCAESYIPEDVCSLIGSKGPFASVERLTLECQDPIMADVMTAWQDR